VRRLALAAAAAALASGCTTDVDPPWQLDHDRIVAVRATPPRIAPGESSTLDVLLAHVGGPTTEQAPDLVQVVSPMSLADALAADGTVTAPDAARLDAARTELGLDAGAPVPLQLGMGAGGFAATKTVWLGEHADNPTLVNVLVDGAAPPASIVVAPDVDVPLSVDADDAKGSVNWLTSCGTMHDFDLKKAYLHVLPEDPQSGELVLVVRDDQGGVVWANWPISAQ